MTTPTYCNPFIPVAPPGKNVTKLVRLRKFRNKIYQDCDVYIGDAVANSQWSLAQSQWHNPFKTGNREDLNKYRQYIESHETLAQEIKDLKGKRLGHFCKPRPCHGNVLLDILQSQDTVEDGDVKKSQENPCQKWDSILTTGERLVYYKGRTFLFSPSFGHRFYDRGHFFHSVLHAYHYERAIHTRNFDLAQTILDSKTTSQAVSTGKKVKVLLDTEIEIMLSLTDAKYDQLKEYAIEGRKYLYSFFMEVSANKKWGIGHDQEAHTFLDDLGLSDFPGENIMGWINKYVLTRRCRGAKGIQYLERFLTYAKRAGKMCPTLEGLERVLEIGCRVLPVSDDM